MKRTLTATTPALMVGTVGVFLAGCNAQVRAFSAVPRHICAGGRVDLEWSVVGSPRVTVVPPSPALPDGPVPKAGHATIAPTTKTRVQLHVTRSFGNPTTSVQEIEVASGVATKETLAASLGDPAASPGCSGGKVWASVHARRFSSDVRVATVASHPTDERSYEVEHAGIRAAVSPGTVVTAFARSPLAGDWFLTAPLGPDETCATVPPILVIDVVTECRPEAPR